MSLGSKVAVIFYIDPKEVESQAVSCPKIRAFIQKLEGDEAMIRVRLPEFGIINTTRIQTGNELENLDNHVRMLFDWFRDPSKFAAPCKPLIQSSGTGKTKLLWDYHVHLRRTNEADANTDATNKATEDAIYSIFISCIEKQDSGDKCDKSTYDFYLTNDQIDKEKAFTKALEDIIKEQSKRKAIVLLFDEAQHLTQGDTKNLFTLRKFLRKRRAEQKIVAVFAGTTTSLANCYPTVEERKSSRNGEPEKNYIKSGYNLYDPIFELYTMGCFAGLILPQTTATEFEQAIPYGRPLFARLLLENHPDANPGAGQCVDHTGTYPVQASKQLTNDDMAIILTRMLIDRTDPFQPSEPELFPIVSIWATRVQIGNTKEILADTLVSKGYAHLTTYTGTTQDDGLHPAFSLSYLPDPVCARLAMCMMTNNFELTGTDRTVVGKSKQEWVNKLGEVLSSGMCGPQRGDLGEMMCATYLLFVGDELREKKDEDLCTFSIPVDQWVEKLVQKESAKMETGPEAMEIYGKGVTCCTVNFIQFCRNSLRFGFKDVCQQEYLKFLYGSCCATYAFESCPLYDAVAAIRTQSGAYVPLIITMKTRDKYTNGSAVKLIDSIVKQLFQIDQKKALVLVVVLDHGKDTQETTKEETTPQGGTTGVNNTWQNAATASRMAAVKECGNMIVSRIVEIPTNDRFNLTKLVRKLTGKEEAGELFSSHSFVGVFDKEKITGCRKNDSGKTDALLTEGTPKEVQEKLSKLWSTMYKISPEGKRKWQSGGTYDTAEVHMGSSQEGASSMHLD